MYSSTDIFPEKWVESFVAFFGIEKKNNDRMTSFITSETEKTTAQVSKKRGFPGDQNIKARIEIYNNIVYTLRAFSITPVTIHEWEDVFAFCDRAWLDVNGFKRRYDATSELNTIGSKCKHKRRIKKRLSGKFSRNEWYLQTTAPIHFLFDWFYLR